jgi:hypothetical protein
MPWTRRYPLVLGVALVAALAGGALLAPASALADAARTVTFGGGCGVRGVGAASEPDAVALAVPAEGLVVFVNHLGVTASLFVDDRPSATLHANEQVSVVFHHGPVSVRLVPACLPVVAAEPVYVAVAGRGPSAVPGAGHLSSHDAVPKAGPAAAHRRGPSKILVLVAAFCVIGVSFATIRAIIAQRAIRTASA